MNQWRARRYSATIGVSHRRHRVTITIRRFRLAKRPNRRHVAVWNIRVGSLKQASFEYQRLGRQKHAAERTVRLRLAGAGLLIFAGMLGVLFSVAALARPEAIEPVKVFTATPKPEPKPAPQSKPASMPKSVPTHITIASQEIDNDLIPVGLNPDGSIETPPVLDWVAGWYKYSPTPGEIGPAVIVGHLDSYQDISVFWRLRYVQPGDTIEIAREDGSTARFSVTQLAQYDQNDFPTKTVYGNTEGPELRVITCGGTFDSTTGHYTENTVVYAKLIS